MSKNQGKRGEMRLASIVSAIAYHVDGVDFTRPTVTNSADMGADLIVHHPTGYLESTLLPVANGTYPHQSANTLGEPQPGVTAALPSSSPKEMEVSITSTTTQRTRLDNKATIGKLGKGTVIEFIANIRKNPDCDGHVLVGGSGLTGPAEKVLNQAKIDFKEDGKTLAHVDNDGITRLARHYRSPEVDQNREALQNNAKPDNLDDGDPNTTKDT